jgi:Arc/MetJ-type ribon-helix-helix transcriptional regulator
MVPGCQQASLNIDPKPKSSDSEKITINLGLIDLGQIDLLVQEGFYSNRTDCIRTAIRNQLVAHAEAVRQTIARKTLVLGLQGSRAETSSVRRPGRSRIHVLIGPYRYRRFACACRDTIDRWSPGALRKSCGEGCIG